MSPRTLTSEQLLRHFIGFDRGNANSSAFPAHNIEKIDDNRYELTLAVAGFNRNDIEMYAHEGVLTISGRKASEVNPERYLHQGITFRNWDRQFNLGEHIVVTDARMADGLLTVELERRVPEQLKPKPIEIRG